MLIQITNRCHMMCPHCMQNSNARGKHMKEKIFFFGKHSTAFAIIPSYRHCVFSSYENGKRIGHGECYSWSDERQREKQEDKERARR